MEQIFEKLLKCMQLQCMQAHRWGKNLKLVCGFFIFNEFNLSLMLYYVINWSMGFIKESEPLLNRTNEWFEKSTCPHWNQPIHIVERSKALNARGVSPNWHVVWDQPLCSEMKSSAFRTRLFYEKLLHVFVSFLKSIRQNSEFSDNKKAF